MKAIDQLASSLGQRDEVPNIALAKVIADKGDKTMVKELVELLEHKKKDIQHDAIKVLYEIGALKPKLIAPYAQTFMKLLEHKNNRLQWGAMTAISTIVQEDPETLYKSLPKIVEVADRGSVITRDYAVNILLQFCGMKQYAKDAFPLFLEQLAGSPPNQVPMYAENAVPVIHESQKGQFIKVLESRLGDIEKDSKKKRVEKVLRKMGK